MSDLLGDPPRKKTSKKKNKRTGPKKRRISAALTRIAKRALQVDPEALRSFEPTELDLAVAESLLAGKIMFTDIGEDIGVSPSTISKRLKDPVACAYISAQVHALVRYRLGMVDAAMLNKAMGGDVRAAGLLYKRYNEMVDRSEVTIRRSDFDPSDLTDAQLKTLVSEYDTRGAKEVPFEELPDDTGDGVPGMGGGLPRRGGLHPAPGGPPRDPSQAKETAGP